MGTKGSRKVLKGIRVSLEKGEEHLEYKDILSLSMSSQGLILRRDLCKIIKYFEKIKFKEFSHWLVAVNIKL